VAHAHSFSEVKKRLAYVKDKHLRNENLSFEFIQLYSPIAKLLPLNDTFIFLEILDFIF